MDLKDEDFLASVSASVSATSPNVAVQKDFKGLKAKAAILVEVAIEIEDKVGEDYPMVEATTRKRLSWRGGQRLWRGR